MNVPASLWRLCFHRHLPVHRGHAWQWECAWQGGMCGRGHAWQGACMVGGMYGRGYGGGMHGRGHAWQILWDTVNEWAVCILLECILFISVGHEWSFPEGNLPFYVIRSNIRQLLNITWLLCCWIRCKQHCPLSLMNIESLSQYF